MSVGQFTLLSLDVRLGDAHHALRRLLLDGHRLLAPMVRSEVGTDTVVDRFDQAAERDPGRVALVADGATMTFAELRERSRAVAGVLAARGIGLEATVGLAIPRSLDWIAALFAVLRVGAAYVP
ncbi:hypothetical protein AMK20_26195, partial [Streptomyces sp. TSRI0261]